MNNNVVWLIAFGIVTVFAVLATLQMISLKVRCKSIRTWVHNRFSSTAIVIIAMVISSTLCFTGYAINSMMRKIAEQDRTIEALRGKVAKRDQRRESPTTTIKGVASRE